MPSLSLSDLPSYLSSLSLPEREALTQPPSLSAHLSERSDDVLDYSPLHARSILTARTPAKTGIDPAAGSIPPEALNNKGIQALFALIGASFVLGAIWFFFWAKNGGFKWQKGDWDEYKSTVLRRKGPDGKTLSNATKSTRLGGGSVVGEGYSDSGGTTTELSSEAPIISEKRKAKKSNKNPHKETARDRKVREAAEARWEGGADNDVRAYRHERVAKVGGLNRDSDAMFYGTDYSQTEPSVAQHATRGQRHSSSRNASPEKRSSGRRDFSYGQDASFASSLQPAPKSSRYHSPSKGANARTTMPGSYVEPLEFDAQSQNTKSYHHPIPGLSGAPRGSGGFRRGRDDLDDE